MEKHDGDPRSHDVTRLDDIGITKMQSSRDRFNVVSLPRILGRTREVSDVTNLVTLSLTVDPGLRLSGALRNTELLRFNAIIATVEGIG
jgi:hypothetical protein